MKSITQYKLQLKKLQTDFKREKLSNSKEVADYIKQFYYEGDIEIFESSFILMLNRDMQTIGYAKISQGGVAGTVVDPLIVAKYAVDSLASAVIIAHNHPSGNLRPSQADKQITKQIKDGLALLNVTMQDHLILTSESHFSFADNGLM